MRDFFYFMYVFCFSLKICFSPPEYGQAESLASFKAKTDVSYRHNLLSSTVLAKSKMVFHSLRFSYHFRSVLDLITEFIYIYS